MEGIGSVMRIVVRLRPCAALNGRFIPRHGRTFIEAMQACLLTFGKMASGSLLVYKMRRRRMKEYIQLCCAGVAGFLYPETAHRRLSRLLCNHPSMLGLFDDNPARR